MDSMESTQGAFNRDIPTSLRERISSMVSRIYTSSVRRIWRRLPVSLRDASLGRAYGRHVHFVVKRQADRKQYFATFFLRNRPELALMCQLLKDKPQGSSINICVLACSKGAEVYSIAWAVRSARPDLKLRIHAVDISEEIVKFAERGVYSLNSNATENANSAVEEVIRRNTCRDQNAPIFERVSQQEMQAIFESEGEEARVKPWLREGISWLQGDASDAELIDQLGPQDIVVANRFLCHMQPSIAEQCLRNMSRLVRARGYLFVSGIDLEVRTRVARDMEWVPVMELMKEVHEGDPSLVEGWPLEYWGVEPFCDEYPDWNIRYASVFQIGQIPTNEA